MLWEQLKPLLPDRQFELLDASKLTPPIYHVSVLDPEETKSPSSGTLHLLPKPYGAINDHVILSNVTVNERLTAKGHF